MIPRKRVKQFLPAAFPNRDPIRRSGHGTRAEPTPHSFPRASWRRTIDAATLVACLRGTRSPDQWASHLRTFFEDVPREAIFRFMLAHELTAARVLATYRGCLPPTNEIVMASTAGSSNWQTLLEQAARPLDELRRAETSTSS